MLAPTLRTAGQRWGSVSATLVSSTVRVPAAPFPSLAVVSKRSVSSITFSSECDTRNRRQSNSSQQAICLGMAGIVGLTAASILWENRKIAYADEEKEDDKKVLDENEKQQQPDMFSKLKSNYNSRIRTWSSPDKIFNVFATVTPGKPNASPPHTHMTLQDFVNAIIPSDFRNDNVGTVYAVPPFFKNIDANGDGLIDYGEFVFFTTLMTIPKSQWSYLFKMFDIDDNGFLDRKEFHTFVEVMRMKSIFSSKARTGPKLNAKTEDMDRVHEAPTYLLERSQGQKGYVNESAFQAFMHEFHSAVSDLEFQHFSTQPGATHLSAYDFAASLLSYAPFHELGSYAKRATSFRTYDGIVTEEDWNSFNTAMNHLDEIVKCMQLFSSSSETEFDKKDFARAVRAVTGINLTPTQVDVVFGVFDRDADGTLCVDEFQSILKNRQSRSLSKDRDVGMVDFFSCVSQCWQNRNSKENSSN